MTNEKLNEYKLWLGPHWQCCNAVVGMVSMTSWGKDSKEVLGNTIDVRHPLPLCDIPEVTPETQPL